MGPPPGALPPEGGRGWGIKPICHICSSIFSFVLFLDCVYMSFLRLVIMYCRHLNIIGHSCCPNILLLSMCILHSTMLRLIRPR